MHVPVFLKLVVTGGNNRKDLTFPTRAPSLKLCFPFRNTFGRKVVQTSEEEERGFFFCIELMSGRRQNRCGIWQANGSCRLTGSSEGTGTFLRTPRVQGSYGLDLEYTVHALVEAAGCR